MIVLFGLAILLALFSRPNYDDDYFHKNYREAIWGEVRGFTIYCKEEARLEEARMLATSWLSAIAEAKAYNRMAGKSWLQNLKEKRESETRMSNAFDAIGCTIEQ